MWHIYTHVKVRIQDIRFEDEIRKRFLKGAKIYNYLTRRREKPVTPKCIIWLNL
jgi:hypothetical protein